MKTDDDDDDDVCLLNHTPTSICLQKVILKFGEKLFVMEGDNLFLNGKAVEATPSYPFAEKAAGNAHTHAHNHTHVHTLDLPEW